MKLIAAIVLAMLMVSAAAGAAQSVSPVEAKRLAVNALRVMSDVELFSTTPQRMSRADYIRLFEAPLMKVNDGWPHPSFAPENKAIEPYQVCVEAVLTLKNLGFHRVNKEKNPALHGKEAERARRAYFEDQKPRCQKAVGVAAVTAPASDPIK